MELIILRTNLVEALGLVERAVSDNTNLPILKNVLVKSQGGKITLVSTNLELAVECSITGKVIKSGETTVPFSILSSIVRNLNTERITISEKDGKFSVESENYGATIQSQSPKEFPIIPTMSDKAGNIKIKATEFGEALSRVVVAAQYSDIRPEISGVFLNYSDDSLTLAATDGFRLSENKLNKKSVVSDTDNTSVIVPLKTATELTRIIGRNEKEMEILIDPNQILFDLADRRVISRLIDGTFPDYKAVIPKKFQGEVTVDRNELLNAIKLASTFSGRANDISMRMGDNKKFLEVYSANSSLGENNYKIPAKLNGDKFSLIFNWRYLLDGLKIYNGKDVVLGVNEPDRPVAMLDPNEPEQIYVAMPIRN